MLQGKQLSCLFLSISIPVSGRSPGEGNGNPLQYSCLENPRERGAWYATVHGVEKSRTRLSDFTFTFTEEGHSAQAQTMFTREVQLCGGKLIGDLLKIGERRTKYFWGDSTSKENEAANHNNLDPVLKKKNLALQRAMSMDKDRVCLETAEVMP